MKNDFPFFKVSSIADQPKIKKEIFKNYLKNNDTLFNIISSHSKRNPGKNFYKLNLLFLKIKINGEHIVIKFFGRNIYKFKITQN